MGGDLIMFVLFCADNTAAHGPISRTTDTCTIDSHEYLYEYDQEMEDRLALHGLDLDKKVIER